MRQKLSAVATTGRNGGGSLPVAALLLLIGGCTKFASELDTDTDPAIETLPLSGDFRCVSEEAGNPIMDPDAPALDYAIETRDYLTGNTPPNLRIRACYRPDVNCMRPATDWLGPDDAGVVTMPLIEGFSGYFEITSDESVPTLYVLPAALTPALIEQLAAVPVSLLPPDALLGFGELGGLELDPAAGVLSMNTFDCQGPAAPGVRVALNASGVPFSFVDGLPITGQDTSTDEGAVGFANVPPGLVVARGYRGDSSELVGLETVLVRASWITVSNLMPQYAGTP